MQQIRETELNIEFLSNDGAETNEFIRPTGNAMYQKAIEQYKAAYNNEEPRPFYMERYAAAQALLTAIKSTGSTSYKDIRKGLMTNSVKTPLGEISFDQKGDLLKALNF